MGLENNYTAGNQGSNFNWQLKMLQELGANNTVLTQILAVLGGAPGADYELWTVTYKANKAGTGYSSGDFILRISVINALTGTITSTIWFNESAGFTIPQPPQADLDIVSGPTTIVLGAGEAHIGAVGGNSKVISPTITTTATAYTANDVVGGKLILTGASRLTGGTTILQSIDVLDNSNQKQPLTILIFNANPSAGTFSDNSPLVWSTDYTKFLCKIDIAASDYESIVSVGLASISGIGKVLTTSGDANLYAVIVTTGTPTYGANATSLYVKFGFLQD